MSHDSAKRLLEQVGTFQERTKAVKSALDLGMPLNEIEQFLDWLEMLDRGSQHEQAHQDTARDGADDDPVA